MAKHLNVNLSFTADTNQAKQALQQLQQELQNLVKNPTGGGKFQLTEEIQNASRAAAELSVHLQQATNTKTGNLDFGKLNQSIIASGKSLSDYSAQLLKMGDSGKAAFSNLVRSVSQAEIPIKRTNVFLTEMGTTIKNAARWQISSSIIHGFMGSVQTAWHYAQNLNDSLNSIRIVTGQSTDQMARFAEQANKAAKDLSTSTLAYTDASLIYYQQGLSDQQVQERTDITIKLANVSNQAAEDVSDQLTAVWNNFDDGSRSLESYVDIMTALGATTASSTEEISTGLEKFAAVADTVGLSFDYAAAALATVTATTRQSADTVGTAFRTLFSRMEGLKLGETLDDGTDLNKYSQAMASVGVNIKEANGEIKDMDQILDETAAAWQNLSKDQQIALAQTVGGVRQYTNFIALMDNWDFMQENLATAAGAEGALQEQADIYAESWEAAQKRVQASVEGIYKSLLNDEFFIDITNGFEAVLSEVNNLIKGMGGVRGVLLGLGAVVTSVFGKQMAEGLRNAAYNLQMMTASGREKVAQQRDTFIKKAIDQALPLSQVESATPEQQARETSLRQQIELQAVLNSKAEEMSDIELLTNQALLDQQQAMGDQAIAMAQQLTKSQEKLTSVRKQNIETIIGNKLNAGMSQDNAIKSMREYSKGVKDLSTNMEALSKLNKIRITDNMTEEDLAKVRSQLYEIQYAIVDIDGKPIGEIVTPSGMSGTEDVKNDLETIRATIVEINGQKLQILTDTSGLDQNKIKNQAGLQAQVNANQEALDQQEKNNSAALQANKNRFNNPVGVPSDWASKLTAAAQATMSFGMSLSTLDGIIDTINNNDLSGIEKLITVFTNLGMIIPMLITSVTSLSKQFPNITKSFINLEEGAGNLATAFSKLASPAGLLGIAGIALTAFTAISSIIDNNIKNIKEKADELTQTFENTKSEIKNNTALTDSYNDALEAYRNATGSKEELITAATNVTKAYGIENGEVLAQIGHYEELSRAIEDAAEKKNTAALQEGEEALRESGKAFIAEARGGIGDGRGFSITGNRYTATFNDSWGGIGLNADISAIMQQALNAGNFETNFDLTSELSRISSITLSTGQSSQELLQAYSDLSTFADDVYTKVKDTLGDEGLDELENSGIWKSIEGYLNDLQESYEKTVELEKQVADLNVSNIFNNLIPDSSSLKTITDFRQAYSDLIDSLLETYSTLLEVDAKSIADTFFSESDYKDLWQSSRVLDVSAGNNTHWETEQGTQELQKLYNQLESSGELDLWAQLHFDEANSYAELMEQIERLRQTARKEDIIVQLKAVQDAKGDLKANMTEQELLDFQTSSGIDWGNEDLGIMSFLDFIQLAYDERVQAIEDIEKTLRTERAKERQNTIDIKEQELAEKQEELRQLENQHYQDSELYGISEQGELDYEKSKSTIEGEINQLIADIEAEGQQIKIEAILDENSETSLYDAATNAMSAWQEEMSGTDIQEFFANSDIDWGQNGILTKAEFINLDSFKEQINYLSQLKAEGLDPIIQEITNEIRQLSSDEELYGLMGDKQQRLEYLTTLLQKLQEEQRQLQMPDFNPEEVDRYAEAIKEQNDDINDGVKVSKEQAKVYEDVAKKLIKYDNAIQKVRDEGEDWIDTLEDLKNIHGDNYKESDDYQVLLTDDVIPAMADLLGIEEDLIDTDFAEKHLEDMIDAANGSEEAMERLSNAFGQNWADNFIESLRQAGAFTDEQLAGIEAAIAAHMDAISSLDDNLVIGDDVTVDSTLYNELVALMNDAAAAAYAGGATLDEAMNAAVAAVNSKGFEPPELEWDTENTQTVQGKTPDGQRVIIDGTETIQEGDGQTSTVTSYHTEKVEGAPWTAELPTIKPKDSGNGTSNTFTKSGGAQRSGGGGGRSRGGGGGGGGGKAKDKKVVEDEQDRYHEIKEVLEDLKRIYDRIQTSKDRAFGKRHLDAIDEEKKAIEDLIEAEQKYVNEAQNYAKSDKAKLDSYGYNINYDEFGRISNYNDVIRQAVERFNNSARSEDDEKAYDEFKEWLDRYEESMDTAEEHIETILDYRNDLYDLDLEKVQYAIELKIDFGQDRLDYLDWVLNRIEEDAFNAGDAIANLGEQAGKLQYMINAGRQGINDVLSHAGATASQIDGILNGSIDWNEMANLNLTADDMDAIKEYRDNLMDYTESLWELRQTVFEELTDAWDAWSEKIENNLDLFEHYESLLEYFNNIVDLVGINMLNISREMRQTTQRANFNVQLNQLAAQRKVMEEYRAQEEEYMEHLNEARARGNEYDIQLWESYLNDVQEAAHEAEENMMDDWATTLETASDMFDQMVEDIIATYEEQLSGMFGNLEGLQQAFDQQTEIADRYVEDYQKIYDLTKLNRDIQNSIDDNDSIKAKTRLRDLQEEINKLQESNVKMSQYDLDYLRKKYELRLAEIQLEDAQNAKSTVRMSRDSENNWSYVYTANEDAMEDAYQNYEDKLYEMQQLNTEYIKELQNNMLQSQIELADAVRELDRSAYGSDEEYKAALDRLRNYYLGQYDYYADEISKALGNNKTTYDQDWTWYSDLTGYKKSADDEYLDKFEETIYSQITGYRDLEDAQDNFREVTEGMVAGLTQAFQEWQANVELAMQTAGTSTEDFANTMYESSEQIQDAAADAEDRTVQMAEEMTAALEENMDSVTNWQQTFSDAIEQTIKEIDELIQHINDLIAAQSGLDKNGNTIETPKQEEAPIPEKAEVIQQEAAQVEEHPYGDTVSYSGNSPNRYFYTKKGTFHLTGTYKDNYAGSDPDARIIQKAWDSFAVRNGSSAALDGSGKLIMKKLGLASGGYTGTWGDNYGRLAFLHQKELVLNPEDTQNMLSAVDVVRNIAHMIDISALSSLAGLGGLSAAPVDTTSQELEQNVHITAEFPNAVDHNEIYQALESLPNMASQFAQRKNK